MEVERAANEIKLLNLQEKVQRLEKEIETLEASKHELSHIIATKTKENVDLFEQQEYEMRIKDQRIKDSEKERKQLLVEMEKALNKNEKDKIQMQQEFEEEKLQLIAKIDKLQENIDELHTFKKQKNKILKENSQLKEQIQKTEKYTSDTIEVAKEKYRNTIREKTEELRQEYEKKQNELRQYTEKHIGAKTMNTMKKNEFLKRELETQQLESKKVMEANNLLIDKNRDLQQKLMISEDQNKKLLEKNAKYKKTVRNLTEKLNNITSFLESRGLSYLSKLNPDEEKQIIKEKDELLSLKDHYANTEQKLKKLEEENGKLNSELGSKQNLQDEIARFLLSTMNDIKLKIGPWKNIDNLYRKNDEVVWKPNSLIPGSLDKLTAIERESVLRYLLSKLHNYEKGLRERYSSTIEEEPETMLPPIHSQPVFHERYKEFRRHEIARF